MKLGQDMNNVHVDEIFSQPQMMAAANRIGLAFGLGFRHVAQLLEPERSSGHSAFVEVLADRDRCLLLDSPKCKVFMEMQFLDQASPKFRDVLDAGVSHLQALMAV